MMVAHFAVKTWNKLHEKPATKEEVYRLMKAERERMKDMYAPSLAKINAASTPRDGAKMMAALRPSNDRCDAMAMAPARFI